MKQPKYDNGFLYHQSCREGRLFLTPSNFKKHLEMGWVESPDDIGKIEVEDKPEPKVEVKPHGVNSYRKRPYKKRT